MNKEDVRELTFTDLENYIGELVFEQDDKYTGYRVLVGYKRYNNQRFVYFTDTKKEEPFYRMKLYSARPEETQERPEIF